MANVFYRAPGNEYPIAVASEGCWIIDKTGRRYLDASGGAAVSTIGHGDRHVIDSIKAQAEKLAYAHTAFFTNDPQEQLAERLAARFHEPGAKVYFTSGGSEATETSLKLVRQFHLSNGDKERHVIISRNASYHGATLGALSVSGTKRRAAYSPLLMDWPRIAPCYAYREMAPDETEAEYSLRAANDLEEAIHLVGANKVAAFIAEPVVGSTLGAVPATEGYFKRIRQICDQFGILLICDEVMCGAGRTGPYFASDADDATPDIMLLGKGLGAGYQPLGAVIARGFIHDVIVGRTGAFDHGHTYIGHAIACAAGNAVLDRIEADDLLGKVEITGKLLREKLEQELSRHPNIGNIRGRGLMLGVEFVEDRATRAPFLSSRKFPGVYRQSAMRNGLICYPDGGNVNGDGAHILLAPPFIITALEVDELVARLCQTVGELLPARAAA